MLCTILNLTNFKCLDEAGENESNFDYYIRLAAPDYLDIYKKYLIEYSNKGEIGEVVLLILCNLFSEENECIVNVLKTEIPTIVFEMVVSQNTSFQVFKEGARILSIFIKNTDFFNIKQLIDHFNFFNSLITDGAFSEIISYGMVGLNNLSKTSHSFLDLYLSMGTIKKIKELDLETKEDYQNIIILNYLDIMINLSQNLPQDKIKELLIDHDILNFIETNLVTVNKHSLKMKCITFILNISNKNIDEVKILITHSIFNQIITLLLFHDFIVRKVCVLIIKNCLLLNDYEIAVLIDKHKAIEIIITKLLAVEQDEEMQLLCIEVLICFLSCGHNIVSVNPLREVMLKYNIEGFINSISNNSDVVENTIKKLQIELSP